MFVGFAVWPLPPLTSNQFLLFAFLNFATDVCGICSLGPASLNIQSVFTFRSEPDPSPPTLSFNIFLFPIVLILTQQIFHRLNIANVAHASSGQFFDNMINNKVKSGSKIFQNSDKKEET
ncbi:unnamed protein product [Lactuca virosa]|uniref:Uncharacterized protein n=1 Tax=Lactuca virosa TaxID=75947 RepID=A0AAU9NB72_9ASTR|nr:unnamed protein product [Lactuca virosa]